MRVGLLVLLAIVLAVPPSALADGRPGRTVVLVHGLVRSKRSMALLARRLEADGFEVVSFGYASRTKSIEALADDLAAAVEECCADRRTEVGFVTHSLGGILVRAYMVDYAAGYRGRVVMLSPPNQGSEIVDSLGDVGIFSAMFGRVAVELGTGADSLPNRLGPARFEVGIITGNRSINPLGSWLIPGPDDGSVSVERAKLEGAADFLVVPHTHTFLMNSHAVAGQVTHFLRQGRFDRGAGAR